MKKYLSLLLISLFSISLFAQTKVDAKKIGKTLEKNKDATAVFTCDMSLSGMKVANDGTVILSAFAKNKVKIVSGMDMTNIAERLNYANKKTYLVTFETTDLKFKTEEKLRQLFKVFECGHFDAMEDVYNAYTSLLSK